jgi:hypothetical protein
MITTIFWNVNTQEDFFNDGPMRVPNSESIRPKLRALTEFAKEKKIKVTKESPAPKEQTIPGKIRTKIIRRACCR